MRSCNSLTVAYCIATHAFALDLLLHALSQHAAQPRGLLGAIAGGGLLGLLVLQSSSSFILDRYEALIREHLFITLFLTMLVGAGGNAGNQSAIKVIRGWCVHVAPAGCGQATRALCSGSHRALSPQATETIQPTTASLRRVLKQQGSVGLLLAVGLSGHISEPIHVTAECRDLRLSETPDAEKYVCIAQLQGLPAFC